MNVYISVDIGGTQIRAAVYPESGLEAIRRERILTHGLNQTAIERMIDLIALVWPGDDVVQAIGVSSPGPLDPYLGVIVAAPNMPGWVDFPLQKILEDRFQVPVILGNDANLATVAEWKYGAGKGYHHVLYMTISTGIGGGVIENDHLILGRRGMATELGHVVVDPNGPLCTCGRYGHLEVYASGPNITQYVCQEVEKGRVSVFSGNLPKDAADVNDAACQGDPLAIEAIHRAGYWIGLALSNYLSIFDPEIIIIGGGVSQCGNRLLDPIWSSMKSHAQTADYLNNLVLTTAALGGDVCLLGALHLARELNEKKDLAAAIRF
ncbi:MAG TPA: ROK family protein [Anaerolineaceae bacterium]